MEEELPGNLCSVRLIIATRQPAPCHKHREGVYGHGVVGFMFPREPPWSREEVRRLPTTEVMDYKELKSYRARLMPSRMVDHRLSRIERLLLGADVDMTTINYVRKAVNQSG